MCSFFIFGVEKIFTMKKLAIVAVAMAITLSSCSFYTCPTYAKKTDKPAKDNKI